MTETIHGLLQHIAQFPAIGQFFAIGIAVGFGEEVAALAIFALARHGSVPWWIAIGGVYVGAWIAHFVLWFSGRLVGHRALSWPLFRKLESSGQLLTIRHHMTREGWIAVGVARFLPGVRVAVFLAAGILGMGPIPFLATLTVVTMVWLLAALGLVQMITEAMMGKPLALVLGVLIVVPLVFLLRNWILRRRARHPAPSGK